jgi:fructose-bisphosphate aldolase class II
MTSNVQRARELMDRSRAGHFAVGAFNVDNQETLLAIVRAAAAKHAPVLVELSHAEAEVIGLANMRSLVDNYRTEYAVPKQLDLELLRRIRDAIDVNISLHGGSGTPGRYFEHAARIGVSKVNVNSDLRYAYLTKLKRQLSEHPDEYAVVKLIAPVINAVQAVVEDRIDFFASAGEARP